MKRYSFLILLVLLFGLLCFTSTGTCSLGLSEQDFMKLTAPDKYWELSEEEINAMSNGCGTNSFHVPSKIYGLDIEEA